MRTMELAAIFVPFGEWFIVNCVVVAALIRSAPFLPPRTSVFYGLVLVAFEAPLPPLSAIWAARGGLGMRQLELD